MSQARPNPAETAVAGSLTNPAHADYLADPFVFRHEGVYFAIGTGAGDPRGGREFPMLRSENFLVWEPIGHALERPHGIGGDSYWAPEIVQEDGVFFLYYSVGKGDRGHHLRVATSARPEGPYLDTGTPLLEPGSALFAIDPHPFRDDDGRWYLFYARDFVDREGGARAGTALAVAPLHDMRAVPAEFQTVLRARHDWQRYQASREIYGGVYDWHTLEGPCVRKHGGLYYCLYSGGNWQDASYGIDYAVADSPLGPWREDNPGYPRVLRTAPGKLVGPGHNSVVLGPDGVTEYLAYHAWGPTLDARRLCFDRLEWTADGPRGKGPTWEPQVIEP